jgi:Holliday junction DNA helicase RuvA
MIARLSGIVDSVADDSIILDVNGIGFRIFVSKKLQAIVKVGERLEIRTLHLFRQETQILCGFQREEEIGIFNAFLEVKGVGIKSSLSILSALTVEEIVIAIINQDADALCRISGIGRKTAARILLELKDKKLPKIDTISEGNSRNNIDDAIGGLTSLGYHEKNVIRIVQGIADRLGKNISTKDLIVHSLKELSDKAR